MNLLATNIHNIAFDDVITFCQQKVLEGVELDYKSKPSGRLAKHFATFSNTLGGLIIIGVGEDDKGLPTTYEGVPNDGKLVDHIHQIAANVTPLPTYEVHTTDEQNGNVFILIRIAEGAATPYVTLNDPTVWIRTGNVSTPASREELLRLVNKKRVAEEKRRARITFADQYFQACVNEAEQARRLAIQAGQENIFTQPLAIDEYSALLSITIQPYYPDHQLITPQILLHGLRQFCGKEYMRTVFSTNEPETIPGGVAAFTWDKSNGRVKGEQLYANGVSSLMIDILDNDPQKDTKIISIKRISYHLYTYLKLVQNYYSLIGYSGLIVGTITLKGGSGASSVPINANEPPFPHNGKVRLACYDWAFEHDTNTLHDDAALNRLFAKLISDISWSFGIPYVPSEAIDDFLQSNGWPTPPNTSF